MIAESERDPNTLHISAAVGYISRNRNRPRRVQIPKENIYITSPFKQGPEKDVKGPALVRLSMDEKILQWKMLIECVVHILVFI